MVMTPVQFYANLGDRFMSMAGRLTPHRGQDFPWSGGTEIPAFRELLMIRAYKHSCLGNVAVLQGSDGVYVGFSHLQQPCAWGPGQVVRVGQVIGLVGTTGSCTTGNHLHMTVSHTSGYPESGAVFDPLTYLAASMGGGSSNPGTGTGDDTVATAAEIAYAVWTMQIANKQGGAGAVYGRAADWLTNMSDAVGVIQGQTTAMLPAVARIDKKAATIPDGGGSGASMTDAQVAALAAKFAQLVKVPTAAENGAAARASIVRP